MKLPIMQTLTIAISLDYWNAPEWLWGGVGLLVLFAWIFAITGMVTQSEKDIFEDNNKNAT